MASEAKSALLASRETLNAMTRARLDRHHEFLRSLPGEKKLYRNECHGTDVVTSQERDIRISLLKTIADMDDYVAAEYEDFSRQRAADVPSQWLLEL